MEKDTYIKGFSFTIDKPKVFIEAQAIPADPTSYESVRLICIEAPRLRSLCSDLSPDMEQFLDKPGNRWLDARTKQQFRQTLKRKCTIWSAATDQWLETKLQLKYLEPHAADCDETVVVLTACDDDQPFESVPLTDNLMFYLQHQAQGEKNGIVYIREGRVAVLEDEKEALYALHDALRRRASGKFKGKKK